MRYMYTHAFIHGGPKRKTSAIYNVGKIIDLDILMIAFLSMPLNSLNARAVGPGGFKLIDRGTGVH